MGDLGIDYDQMERVLIRARHALSIKPDDRAFIIKTNQKILDRLPAESITPQIVKKALRSFNDFLLGE